MTRSFRIVVISSLPLVVALAINWRTAAAQQSNSSGSAPLLLPVESTPEPIVVSQHVQIETYAGTTQEKARREINLLSDESAVSHGTTTEFYKNGQKFSEGRFENGLRVGEWKFWFENGTVCKTVQFKSGVPHGQWSVFWDDGKPRATRNYADGKPQGEWLIYAKDGETILEERRFEGGQPHGKWVETYASGKPHIEAQYAAGQRNGKYMEWDQQGQLQREMNFKNGQLDGRVVLRGSGGRDMVQFYRDGQLVPDGPQSGSE